MPGEFDDIRERLETIAEELTDLAILRLRESIDAGGIELPVDEKRLTRARRQRVAHVPSAERPSTAPLRSTETGPSSLTAITVARGSS